MTKREFNFPRISLCDLRFLCDLCGKDVDIEFVFLRVSVPPWWILVAVAFDFQITNQKSEITNLQLLPELNKADRGFD